MGIIIVLQLMQILHNYMHGCVLQNRGAYNFFLLVSIFVRSRYVFSCVK